MNDTVTKAMRLFEENHGTEMGSSFNNLATTVTAPGIPNPYLQVLRITTDYKVEIKFASGAKSAKNPDSTSTSFNVPVAKGLLGIDIVLIPVYNQGDEKISAWECVTNADNNIQEFIGATAKEYSASYIREATSNPYLSLCTYINRENLVEAQSTTQQ